jgi:electron transfer flavoprotein alpha subunit
VNQDIYVLVEHLRGQVANISHVMLAAAHAISKETGGNVVAVLLSHQSQELANGLAANRVLYFDNPLLADFTSRAYLDVLSSLIHEDQPRLVLFGDTSIGAEVAAGLSARLGLPLISYCRSIRAQDGLLRYTSQICGGKIMVEGEIPGSTALVTMIPGGFKADQGESAQPPVVELKSAPALESQPIRLKGYIEPDTHDVDISKERILVSVGRGIQNQDNLPQVQELADALGGVVSSSRPLVDMGWLPSTRLVGKSGKRVKPKIYLALGISGAPEHTEAITDSEVILAVNTDPEAPIFNLAQYGAVIDLLDLIPALTESVKLARKAEKV